MPTPYGGMGTDNPWFAIAIDTAKVVELPGGARIRVVAAPVHLATKVTAFESRGGGDLLLSKDFEDIVALLDGRHTIVDEVRSAPSGVRQFLADWCERVLASPWIADAIAGHVSRASGPGRVDLVLERMQRIAAQ